VDEEREAIATSNTQLINEEEVRVIISGFNQDLSIVSFFILEY